MSSAAYASFDASFSREDRVEDEIVTEFCRSGMDGGQFHRPLLSGLRHFIRNGKPIVVTYLRGLGWRSGKSIRLPPMWLGFHFLTRRHIWSEFLGSLLCSERFYPGTPVLPSL